MRTKNFKIFFLIINISKSELQRSIDIEISKKVQQKGHLEEDLDHILSDADLEQYKKLGNLIKTYDNDLSQLQLSKKKT